MICLTGVTKRFGGRVAVADASFSLPAGGRTAVLGVNGAGKSTLLRLTGGLVQPDEGVVSRPPTTTVAYVPQDLGAPQLASLSGREFLRERVGIAAVESAMDALLPRVEAADGPALAEYGDLLDRYTALGGYDADARIERAIDQVGLDAAALARHTATLSGGEQVRLGLAGILASTFDVYLLDEPTNHLDRDGVELLERFLLDSNATVLLVSHDRQLLDRVATHVITIDEMDHRVALHNLTYAEHRRAAEAARSQQEQRHRAYRSEVERLTSVAQAQASTAARTRDARPARDNDKFAGHFLTQRSARQAAGAARRVERRLERLEVVEAPPTPWELRVSLTPGGRSGDQVVSASAAVARAGAFTLGPVDLHIRWGERVALSGRNGAGKSLLLSLLTGGVAPDTGRVDRGSGVRFGVLHQGGLRPRADETGLATFRGRTGWTAAESRTLLAKFDLGAAHVLRPVAGYSPGERCRLALATLVAQQANCLVLDEPTNHLDLEAREQLECAVAGFGGTVVVVSHDRTFLAGIGLTREVQLDAGRIVGDRLR